MALRILFPQSYYDFEIFLGVTSSFYEVLKEERGLRFLLNLKPFPQLPCGSFLYP